MLAALREAVQTHLKAQVDGTAVYAFTPSSAGGNRVVVRVGNVRWAPHFDLVPVEIDVIVPVTTDADRRVTDLSDRVYTAVQSFAADEFSWASEPFETSISEPSVVPGDAGDVAVATVSATIIRSR